MPSIQDFLAQMSKTNNFAQPSRYRVEIQITNLFSKLQQVTNLSTGYDINWAEWFAETDAQTTARRLMVYCSKAEIPGVSLTTDEHRHYGPTFKVPYIQAFGDAELRFYVGADMFERWFFEGWIHSIVEPATNDFNYVTEYATTIDIYQENLTNENTWLCTLTEAYPIAINQLDLDYESVDQIHQISVTFTYKKSITTTQNIADMRSDNTAGREGGERFGDTIQVGGKPSGSPSQSTSK